MLSIGLMSGTSMDGIDAVLLETDGTDQQIQYHAAISLPYHEFSQRLLKSAEYAVKQCHGDLNQARKRYSLLLKKYLSELFNLSEEEVNKQIKMLSTYLFGAAIHDCLITLEDVIQHSTTLHIRAVDLLLKKCGYSAKQIDVIGYHGQTLFHSPETKTSISIGDGQRLADETQISVVNDFRGCDIEMGGEGAPFAPLYHQALVSQSKQCPTAIVNCGGIANVTFVWDENPLNLIAFDTGPGNTLLDRFVQQHTQGKENMDVDGHYGYQGKVHPDILSALYDNAIERPGENYFSKLPPKSLDVNDFVLIPELNTLSLENGCRTLAAFTADTIVQSVSLIGKDIPQHWVLAGGGWKNPVIRLEFETCLQKKLGKPVLIKTADEMGWQSQSLEAQIFAWLAVRSLKKLPLSMPNTTGVSAPITGGVLHLPG
ncbi:MAG: anhydro-N-acetylmuramic acid kinase [Gammaproteobacteria bacterium]|nr:anhydro-N-acetylmuramic acid kinase [Gammaproteobacteria bacterium]